MSKSSEEGAGNGAAGQETAGGQKDAANIYENREGTKKIIRVVTVMAYVFSVSFAAILLSAYYVFLWQPPNPRDIQRHPLTSDPHPEYLTDKILPHSNSYAMLKSRNLTEVQDNRVVEYHPALEARPQELLAFEDLPMNDAPVTETPKIDGDKVSVNKTASSLRPAGKEDRKFILWENMRISSTKRYEDSSSSVETTPTSPGIHYSYPQTIGDTAQYDKGKPIFHHFIVVVRIYLSAMEHGNQTPETAPVTCILNRSNHQSSLLCNHRISLSKNSAQSFQRNYSSHPRVRK